MILKEHSGIVKIEASFDNVHITKRSGNSKFLESLQLLNYYFVEAENGKYKTIFNKRVNKEYYSSSKYIPYNTDFYELDMNIAQHFSVRLARLKKLKRVEKYRILYFDIETKGSIDTLNTPAEIISIASFDSFTKEYKFWCFPSDFATEESMLADFIQYMEHFDIITGWNVIKFDCPYLINRCKLLGVKGNFYTKSGRKTATMRSDIKSFISGINIVDLVVVFMKIVEWLMVRPPDFRLETISKMFLDDVHKMELEESPWKLWEKGDIKTLKKYNIIDVECCYLIDKKFGLIEFLQHTQDLVPALNIEDVPYNSKIIDYYIMSNFDYVYPAKNFNANTDYIIPGALVFDTVPGFHDNVAIFDFSGMYQNIIKSFNISPDTLSPDGDIVIGSNKFVSNKVGILNAITTDFINMRNTYKKIKNKYKGVDENKHKLWFYKESCVKKITNSIYGVFGYSNFRLYNPRISESITYIGRELLRFVKKHAELQGFIVIYGDTDSIFIKHKDKKTLAEINDDFTEFTNIINDKLIIFVKDFIKNDELAAKHTLNVEFETLFRRMVMTTAKKRYVGFISKWKGSMLKEEELYYKGIELTRKDTPLGIKKLLVEIVEDILKDVDFAKIKDKISICKKELKLLAVSDLIIYKNLTREISEYKVLPQHARAAQYSNAHLNTDFSKENYRGGMVFVSSVRAGLPPTDVIFLEPNTKLPVGFSVNYTKYFDMFIEGKIKLIFGEKFFSDNLQSGTLFEWIM